MTLRMLAVSRGIIIRKDLFEYTFVQAVGQQCVHNFLSLYVFIK